MQSDTPIEKKYEQALNQSIAGNVLFSHSAKQQMAQLLNEQNETMQIIAGRLNTNQSNFVKGGFIAEEFHATTFNQEAILNGNTNRAFTDNRTGWGLEKNANPDIIIRDNNGNIQSQAQSKYFKNSHDTAGALSEVKNGKVKYADNDTYLAPSDQVNGVKTQSLKNIETNKSRNGDLIQREAFQQTHDKVKGTISDGKTSSHELTKKEADTLGSGDLKKIDKINAQLKTRSTVQQMQNAAIGAATMSAIVSGTINTVTYIQKVRNSEMTVEEATKAIFIETACSAADSATKASAVVGVQSLIVKYGTEKVVVNTLAKQTLGAVARTNAISIAVLCAIDAIKDLVKLGSGKITKEEFEERQGKNILNTSAGVVGSSIGMVAVGGLGLTGTSLAILSFAGAMSGGIIAGLAMSFAIENGVEKPYKELIQNTSLLNESARELEKISQNIFLGQVCFTKYFEEDVRLEKNIQQQFKNIDKAGNNALESILKI